MMYHLSHESLLSDANDTPLSHQLIDSIISSADAKTSLCICFGYPLNPVDNPAGYIPTQQAGYGTKSD
jgi:hypothetical protein